jgi:Transposase domain (DUF772)
MLAEADSRRVGFFDAAWCGKAVRRDSFYGLLAGHGGRIVCDGDFAGCYSERRGRPSIPPSLLAKILLLEYRSGVSDRQAMEAVRFDLRWKVALGLPLDHEGFHPTAWSGFGHGCSCTARSGSPSSARSSLRVSSACLTMRSSGWSIRRRCWALPPLRTRSRWCAAVCGGCSVGSRARTPKLRRGWPVTSPSTIGGRVGSRTATGARSRRGRGC